MTASEADAACGIVCTACDNVWFTQAHGHPVLCFWCHMDAVESREYGAPDKHTHPVDAKRTSRFQRRREAAP